MLSQIFLFLLLSTLSNEERVITTTKYSTYKVEPKIVNGNKAKKGQVPYLVSIKEAIEKIDYDKQLWRNLCGGSIIDEFKVLTAAHCFESRNFYYLKHPNLLRVVAGSLENEMVDTGETKTTDEAQWRTIDKITIHREFQFPTHDIALVIVDSPFVFSETVDYVVPATLTTDYPRTCQAAGFGQIGTNYSYSDVSNVLLWADMDVLSRRQCDMWWEMNMDTFICTTSQVTDVAGGDSGGPLTCYGTWDRAEKKDKDLLVGIVSGKNHDKTSLFTRVSAYNNWLLAGGTCSSWRPTKFVVVCLVIILFYLRLLILIILIFYSSW